MKLATGRHTTATLHDDKHGLRVTTTFTDDGSHGITAFIRHDPAWLYIHTGYEQQAMLHISALPELRKALAIVARRMKS